MKKHLLAIVFMVVASTAASPAQAAAVALPCNACTSSEASQIARGQGAGIHYVYDFNNAILRKFEVSIERDQVPGQYTTFADEVPVEPGNAKYFAMLVDARRDFGTVSAISVPITIGQGDVSPSGRGLGGITAADVLRSSQTRNDLFDFILAQQKRVFSRSGLPANTTENLVGLLQSLDKVFTKGELLNVVLKITFSDGSKITVTLGDGDAVAIVSRTARDRDNNSIPDANVADFSGVFSFSSGSTRDSFVAVARQYGISVGGGGSLKYSCTWDGTKLTCKPI